MSSSVLQHAYALTDVSLSQEPSNDLRFLQARGP